MGNAHTEDFRNPQFIAELQERYVKTKSYEDSRFGDVQIFHHKHDPSQKILFKQRWTNTASESKQLHNFIETRRNITDPNIAKLPYYEVSEEKQMMNTFHRHSMGFEFYPKTLQTEIEKNTKSRITECPPDESQFISKTGYTEDELWYLLKSVASTVYAFRNAGYHHGDIQPHNVMIDNSGEAKIIDNSLANYGRTGYHKILYGQDYKTCLSPILIDSLKDKVRDPNHDKVKSDVFSTGMTVLSAGTNSDFNRYYDWTNKRVKMPFNFVGEEENLHVEDNDHQFENQRQYGNPTGNSVHNGQYVNEVGKGLTEMKDHYSPELVDLTAWMLEFEEEKRPDIDQVMGAIDAHYGQVKVAAPVPEPIPEPVAEPNYETKDLFDYDNSLHSAKYDNGAQYSNNLQTKDSQWVVEQQPISGGNQGYVSEVQPAQPQYYQEPQYTQQNTANTGFGNGFQGNNNAFGTFGNGY